MENSKKKSWIKRIWIRVVKLFGWKLILPKDCSKLERCVFVVAPHTSAFDFIIGATYLWSCCSNGKVFIKKEFFIWPLGPLLRSLGCISVDRGNRKNDLVGTAVRKFAEGGPLSIAITPEGSRKAVIQWKRGFWMIASKAHVPIVLTYIDFKKKEIGIFDIIEPTENYEADLNLIRSYYHKDIAKYPENFIELTKVST